MKKALLLFLGLLLFLSSCIEIKETLTVNKDGSGNICLEVDMGKADKAFSQQNQQGNILFVNEIQSTPEKADSLLRSCKGISNLKTNAGNKGLYSVSFDFKNSKSLNEALYKLFRQKKSAFRPDLVKVSKHKIRQMSFAPIIKKYAFRESSNMFSDLIYQMIKIETVYELPSGMKTVSNIKAITENDSKKVILKYCLFELLNNDFDYCITIKY